MADAQIGTLVNKDRVIDPEYDPLDDTSDIQKGGATADLSAYTRDIFNMRSVLKDNPGVTNGLFTDEYMNTLTDNDLLFEIRNNWDALSEGLVDAEAWAQTTDYDKGAKVTNSSKTLQATNSGTSKTGLAPSNPGTGKTVVDGTVTWYQID